MKKKSLLVFLLAMASTAAVGAAGCSDSDDTNEHNWTLQHNANYHWYTCGDCDLEKDSGSHVDSDNDGKCDVCEEAIGYTMGRDDDKHWKTYENGEVVTDGHIDLVDNESGEEGRDGLCDVCDVHMKETVTFIVGGHGTAPAVQKVNYGGHAEEPSAPEATGYIFKGWYEDDGCTVEFDFDEKAITGTTLVYAKWEDDTTPGYNRFNAKELALEDSSLTNALNFGTANKLYFKFTASESARYTISNGSGAASEACTFTTDLDEDGAEYDVGTPKHFDMEKGETVVIVLNRATTVTDTQKVVVYIAKNVREPIPESWEDGVYTDSEYFVTIVKAKDGNQDTVLFNKSGHDAVAVPFNYIGGKTNSLTFTTADGNKYSMKPNSDGDYNLYSENSEKPVAIISNAATSNPIPVSAFAGIYTPETTKVLDIDEIGIYENGDGYYRQNGVPKNNQILGSGGCMYVQVINTLIYSKGSMTLNFNDEGEVVSLTLTYSVNGKPNKTTYLKTAEAPDIVPSALPLDEGDYAGHSYSIKVSSGYQYWNDSGYMVYVDEFVKATGTYTIIAKSETYKLTIDDSVEGKPVIRVYDTEDNLLDTLRVYEPAVSADLPADKADLTLSIEGFVKGCYYYNVTESGWYKFSADETVDETTKKSMADWLVVNANINLEYPKSFIRGNTGFKSDSYAIWLEKGSIVCISLKAGNGRPASFKFTVDNVGEEGAPLGTVETKPNVLDGTGIFEVTLISCYDYYADVYLPVGKYLISLNTSLYKYTVNGVEIADGKKYVAVEVTDADVPVKIVVSALDERGNVETYSFTVEEDFTASNVLTFDEEVKGTLTDGAYFHGDLAGTYALFSSFVLGSDDGPEFTISMNGVEKTVSKISLTSAQVAHGFKVTLGEEQESVAYSVVFLKGSVHNPIEHKTPGKLTVDLTGKGAERYVTVTAPEDTDCLVSLISNDDAKYGFTVGNKNYGYQAYLSGQYYPAFDKYCEVPAGQSVTIKVFCPNPDIASGSVSVLLSYDFMNAEELSTVKGGTTNDGAFYRVANVTVDGDKLFHIDDTVKGSVTVTAYAPFTLVNADTTVYKVTDANGLYTATIPAGEDIYFKVSSETEQNITFAILYLKGSYGNPVTVGAEDSVVELTAAGNTSNYIQFLAGGEYIANKLLVRVSDGELIEANVQFTANTNEMFIYSNSAAKTETVNIFLPVKAEYQGKYSYDNGKVLVVSELSLVVEGKPYFISGVDGTTYKFSYKTADGVEELTVSFGDKNMFGEYEIEYIYMFTEEMAQTYTGTLSDSYGWVNYDVTLSFDRKGKGTFTAGTLVNSAISIKDNEDGTYTFTYTRGTVTGEKATFKFGAMGTIVISADYFALGKLTPENEFFYDPTGGEYTPKPATFEEDACQLYTYESTCLSLTSDGTGKFTYSGNTYDITVMVVKGIYSFEYDGNKASFTFSDEGVINLSTDKHGEFTLSPETEFEAPAYNLFSESQIGTYIGYGKINYASVMITMTLYANGTCDFEYSASGYWGSDSVSENVSIIDFFGELSFSYESSRSGTSNAMFEFNENGNIVLNTDTAGVGIIMTKPVSSFSEEQVGTYNGESTQMNCKVLLSLTLRADGSATFKYQFNTNPIESYDVIILKNGDEYSFDWNGYSEKFKFVKKGKISGTSNRGMAAYTLKDPTVEPEEIFTEEQVGTYVGKTTQMAMGGDAPVEISLTFDKVGVGTFSYNFNGNGAVKHEIEIEKSGDSYSFTWDSGYEKETFTINKDGTLSFTSTKANPYTLSVAPKTPDTPDVALVAGTYYGVNKKEFKTRLVINADLKTGTYYIDDPDDPTSYKVEIEWKDGAYTYTYVAGSTVDTVKFTFDGKVTLSIVDTYYGNFDVEKGEDVSDVPEGDLKTGTYIGTGHNPGGDEINLTLVVEDGLKATYTGSDETNFNFTLVYEDGVYTAEYVSGSNMSITVNEDGTLSVVDSYYGEFILTSTGR